ncbi:glycosyltransferase family 2 protein [Aliiroseovarius sp. KMU-50]|uniref:Glycosyltransferase family 2 protein n=1 Tax=Aliiroseovarius salicola TaxID=3009082 RepID=A0ABT4VXP4_9RHOB|nr:glycosyltransferase family 2 protein [Aliiroseovarius sp. KMU-50]MDA5093035.1 glycosyltransferase family 2 protein [Aliiroseovarius sp. KMU-50]
MAAGVSALWSAYRMRLKRRRLLLRAIRSRHQLDVVVDRTATIPPGQILAFTTLRNEMQRLPHFLEHYRNLGIGHFLMVANDCSDGTQEFLTEQPDVSLWRTDASYKASRFGVDWLNWLQFRFGNAKWCLTVDVDEILIYPHWQTRDLHALTARLELSGANALGAMMLDLYPKGPLGAGTYSAGQEPTELLNWFDPSPYRATRQMPMQNLWLQGGARERMFFADCPERGPTLNKLPLVKWNRRFAYANSTHSALPPKLNLEWSGPKAISGDARLSGVLLHTKFLPDIVERSQEEKQRGQHFGQPDQHDAYYDGVVGAPDMWYDHAVLYQGWKQLCALGLMSTGEWN